MWCSSSCPRSAGKSRPATPAPWSSRSRRPTTSTRRVSGEVTEANKLAVADPALVNSEPYAAGWFYKIKLSNPAELDALLTPEQYQAQIGGK